MTVDVYADNTVTTRIPRQLIESDIHGKGAAEIGWGTPGDFSRCEKFARIHGIPAHMRDGFCANLHKLATGEWPGRNAHKGMHALIAAAALDYMIAAAAPDTSKLIRWEGPLAQIESPTGDKRRFPRDTLTYQSFPMPFRFQRVGLQGHQGAVTVGVIEHAAERDHEGQRVVYGHGYFLDPDVVPEVNEAVHLAEHGVAGPSVDLDSYTAVVKKNALSGETTADMVRGRQRAATLVAVPAFANLRITVMRPKGQPTMSEESDGPDAAIVASSATFAVNTTGWHGAPIAPREALFDADDAAKRIEGWANGDPEKMASMFLWIADSANAPLIGRKGYRLPWGDIVDGKPYLIFHAVYAAAALLEGAHGGLPAVPDEDKAKLRTIISAIYEDLAAEYNDPSIIAPWDRAAQQQASAVLAWNDADATDIDEYAFYVSCHTAALEEFARHHRYVESKHPRNPSKGDPAGEWIDTPHGPHGQIKVGNKWVYPPKRGEKGYKSPESSARATAKRGGGKPGAKSDAKSGPSTHVAKKASPDKGSVHKAPPKTAHPSEESREDLHRKMSFVQARIDDDDERGGVLPKKQRDALEGEKDRIQQRLDELDAQEHQKKAPEKKTVAKKTVAKKAPEAKAPEAKGPSLSDRLTLRLARDAGDDGTWLKHADSKDKRESATRLQEQGLLESHRKGNRTYLKITDKGREALKGHEDEEPDKKAPEVKGPEVRKKTTVVRKSTGEVKERKLTDAQQRGLESIRDGGKAHPGSRKVLQREGFLDSEGNLTQKGKDHLGVKETKAPETKVAKTVVGKKEHKLTAAQQKALEAMREDQGVGVHAGTRKVLEREGYLGSNGRLTDKARKHLGMEAGDKEQEEHDRRVAEAKRKLTEQKKADDQAKTVVAKKIPAEVDKEKVDTALAKYRALGNDKDVDEVLAGLQRRHLEQIAKAEGLDVSRSETTGSLRDWLRQKKRHDLDMEDMQQRQREYVPKNQANAKRREADYKARKHSADQFKPDRGKPWWEQVTEDTGPEGVRAVDVPLTPGTAGDYIMGSGTLYRHDGISYLIEDGDDMLAPSDVAEQFDKFHRSLPPELAAYQKSYVWVRGANPSDSYWEKHYNTPGFSSLATAGDGSVRLWNQGGTLSGPASHGDTLRHEAGHSIAFGEGRRTNSPALHDTEEWHDAAKSDFARRPSWMEKVRYAKRFEGGPATQFTLVPGGEGKGFKLGVTGYGQNSPAEDFAESMSLYTHDGPLGFIRRGHSEVAVYFHDLFPARAQELDKLLPEIAKRQRALIEQRGPL